MVVGLLLLLLLLLRGKEICRIDLSLCGEDNRLGGHHHLWVWVGWSHVVTGLTPNGRLLLLAGFDKTNAYNRDENRLSSGDFINDVIRRCA